MVARPWSSSRLSCGERLLLRCDRTPGILSLRNRERIPHLELGGGNGAPLALRDEDITLYGDGLQTRSFQYCDDLIEAMRRFMELPRETVDEFCAKSSLGAPVVNTGNPGEYTIRELAEEVLRQLPDSKSKLAFAPLPSDDPKRRRPDITLAKELLGWEPKVALREGLARTIEYFRSAGKI